MNGKKYDGQMRNFVLLQRKSLLKSEKSKENQLKMINCF